MHLRPTTWSRPSARSMAVAAVASVALLLSGCSEFSPQTTQLQYVPSDGAQGDLGDVGIRNALLITDTLDRDASADPNAAAAFVGTLTNTGDADATVQLRTADGAETSVPVPADGSVQISPSADQQWQVDQVGAVPGQTVTVTVTVAGEQLELEVPVLDGTLPEYKTLAPTGAASQDPTATGSPAEGTGSPAAESPATQSPTGDGATATPTAAEPTATATN